MSAQTPAKITLEEITQRKKKLLNEIQAQKRAMTATTREIFSPLAPAANKADSLMRSFNTGMAIFDGNTAATFTGTGETTLSLNVAEGQELAPGQYTDTLTFTASAE